MPLVQPMKYWIITKCLRPNIPYRSVLKLFVLFVDLFRAAAEANPSDILKLYNVKGNIININERLPENTPEQPYRLEVVASSFKGSNCWYLPYSHVITVFFL